MWPNIRFLPSIVAEKNATKNILGRTEGQTDGRTDRGKTVYPPPVERGYNKAKRQKSDSINAEEEFAIPDIINGNINNPKWSYSKIIRVHFLFRLRLLLEFGIVPTVWYFVLFFQLITREIESPDYPIHKRSDCKSK